MKTFWTRTANIFSVIAMALFSTCLLNVIPTFWKKEIMDVTIIWGITVRVLITFLVFLSLAILLSKQIAKIQDQVLLAALLPLIIWGIQSLFYLNGKGSDVAQAYPLYGIMLCYTAGMMLESFVLEIKYKTLSWKDLLEDALFSLALWVLFYGITTLLGLKPFAMSTLGLTPVLALVQLWLAKAYHTPKVKKAAPPPSKT